MGEIRRLRNLLVMVVLAAALAGSLLWFFAPRPYAHAVLPTGEQWRLEVARKSEDLVKGLSGRPNLPPGRGLLMDFSRDGYHGIWMKDMNFPIDIIWLDSGFSVVKIQERAQPSDYPRVYVPPVPARYVLEVPAGAAARLKAGDKLRLETVFGR